MSCPLTVWYAGEVGQLHHVMRVVLINVEQGYYDQPVM